jgi:hypothetical protein
MNTIMNNPEKIIHTLPHVVLKYVRDHYPNGTIYDMILDINVHGELKYYEVDVVDAFNTYHLRFDLKGHFVHEEIEVGNIEVEEKNPEIIDLKQPSVIDEELEEF